MNTAGQGAANELRCVYTHGYHDSVLRSHRWRTAENSAAYLLPHLAPGMSLLDIGCGAGTITADLATRVAPGRVTAVEISEAALRLARDEAARRGQASIDFRVADARSLSLPDAAFDVVHAHQVLQHLADPVGALREMRRVCRPGGIIAARDGDFGTFTWHPHHPDLDEWLTLYSQAATDNGGNPHAGRHLRAWALAAGFRETDLAATAGSWCFASQEDRTWWANTWAERTTRSDLGRQLVASGTATPTDLDRFARAWHQWAANPDGWFAVLHGEIICRESDVGLVVERMWHA
ncbi:MAG: methyltransferase domain-containing protein [Micromonosporaceae bacterium]|nr:methyltransferase domain-containing protein [Micromonosporaceae bacterium]